MHASLVSQPVPEGRARIWRRRGPRPSTDMEISPFSMQNNQPLSALEKTQWNKPSWDGSSRDPSFSPHSQMIYLMRSLLQEPLEWLHGSGKMRYRVRDVELSTKVRLQYVEQGSSSGHALILLHGYADSWRSFESVLPHLPRSVRVFALTQRGHGDASRPTIGYAPHDFAMDLAAFMDALDLETAVIAGGSSGGIVARRFAIDHPQRAEGLVLIGSPLSLRGKPGVLDLWDSTISKMEDPIDPDFVRTFIESQLARKVPKTFLETMREENLKVPARVWKATLEGLLEDHSSEELDKITAPTLIICGDKDTIISLSEQETLLKKIRGSRLLVYPGAGHALYWEEPAHIASDIKAFIEDIHHTANPLVIRGRVRKVMQSHFPSAHGVGYRLHRFRQYLSRLPKPCSQR